MTSGTVQGNFIGTDPNGDTNLGNGFNGIFLGDYGNAGLPATNVTVGGTDQGAGNVLSGNMGYGISIYGNGATGHLVQGNKIGTNKDGTAAVGNTLGGVFISNGAINNTIGGTMSAARNIISGNGGGIGLEGFFTTGNLIQGNYIGVDNSGASALANTGTGIIAYDGAFNNTIGGTDQGAGNVISANQGEGIYLAGTGVEDNVIQGNKIGTDKDGSDPLSNTGNGILIGDGADNTIGGTDQGGRQRPLGQRPERDRHRGRG